MKKSDVRTSKTEEIKNQYYAKVSTYLITFCVSLLFLPFFVEIMNVKPKIAGALVILCCTVISYFGHSKFSFRAL